MRNDVKIEDLLQLKRAERPSPEFWSKFDRELRQKQLTALVQKRRWWHDLPVVFSRRVYVPAGMAAAVAFTMVAVRYSGSSTAADIPNLAPAPVETARAVETLPVTEVAIVAQPTRSADVDTLPSVRSESAAALAENDATEAVQVAAFADREVSSPSARSIAANLARLEQSEPELVNSVLGSRLSAPPRAQMASATSPDTDSSRRYRLIARYADHSLSPEPSAPAMVRERIARRLGDDLNDRMSRIGVEGSQVSLKF